MGLFKNKEIKEIEVEKKIYYDIPKHEMMFGGTSMTSDEYTCKCEYTDYAILTGLDKSLGWIIKEDGSYYHVLFSTGKQSEYDLDYYYYDIFSYGIRPKTSYSSINNKSKIVKTTNEVNEGILDDRLKKRYFEIEFGEYPQFIISNDIAKELEDLFSKNELDITGKNYISSIGDNSECYIEYIYKGKKYIRVVAKNKEYNGNISNGEKYEVGKTYWLEVSPIIWYVDNDYVLSKYVLFSGVPYNKNYGYFEDYFAKDIVPSETVLLKDEKIKALSSSKKELSIINDNKVLTIIEEINSKEIESINLNDLESAMNYGEELSIYTAFINEEYKKLITNKLFKTSLSNIENVVDSIRSTKDNKKLSLIERLRNKKGTIERKQISLSVVEDLNKEINKGIIEIQKEIIAYDKIRKYHEGHIKRLKKYIEIINENINNQTIIINNMNELDEERFNKLAIIEILKNKLNSFEVSLASRCAELMQIQTTIVNHYTTLSILKTAKEDLIPIIFNEIVINNSNNLQKDSFELSRCVINLFSGLLNNNSTLVRNNLEELKVYSLPESTLNKIEIDINKEPMLLPKKNS